MGYPPSGPRYHYAVVAGAVPRLRDMAVDQVAAALYQVDCYRLPESNHVVEIPPDRCAQGYRRRQRNRRDSGRGGVFKP